MPRGSPRPVSLKFLEKQKVSDELDKELRRSRREYQDDTYYQSSKADVEKAKRNKREEKLRRKQRKAESIPPDTSYEEAA